MSVCVYVHTVIMMRRLISQVWREQNKNTEINVHLIVNTSDNRRQKIWKNTK